MANSKPASKPRKRTGSGASNGSSPKSPKTAKAKSSRSRPAKAASRAKPTASARSRSGNSGSSSSGGSGGGSSPSSSPSSSGLTAKVGQAAGTVKDAAAKAKGPAVAVGAAAAGVAGGMLLKGRLGRKRVLGMPLPRSLNGTHLPDVDAKSIAKSIGNASQSFAKASKTVSRDIERAGEQAERIGTILSPKGSGDEGGQASRRSPVEVVLDGLTHRRD